jgi:hypothetical protein
MKKPIIILLLFNLMTFMCVQTIKGHHCPAPDTLYLVIDKHTIPLHRSEFIYPIRFSWIKSMNYEIPYGSLHFRCDQKIFIHFKRRYKKRLLKLFEDKIIVDTNLQLD